MVQCGTLRADMAVLGDRDRLAARASPLPQVRPSRTHCMLDGLPLRLRSGDMPERGALEPHLVIRYLPTGTSVLHPGTLPQLPWSVGPALSASLPSYQSSLLKLCRPSNKTVHHMRHCFCTHSSSTFCETQTKTTSASLLHGHLQSKATRSQDVWRKYVHLRLTSLSE